MLNAENDKSAIFALLFFGFLFPQLNCHQIFHQAPLVLVISRAEYSTFRLFKSRELSSGILNFSSFVSSISYTSSFMSLVFLYLFPVRSFHLFIYLFKS